jgi:hypothetical protein
MLAMKRLYFILFIALAFSCKKKEEPAPVSKSAPLVIEFTGSSSDVITATVYLTPYLQNSEYFYTDTSTSISYTITKPDFKGGQKITAGSINYLANGDFKNGGTYTLKVTYNGQVLANESFTNSSNDHTTGVNVDLPFIE